MQSYFMSCRRCVSILVVVVTFSLLHMGCNAKKEDAETKPRKTLNVAECRARGFDPMRLSCPTCDLLPEKDKLACQGCCQSFLDVPRRTHPYESAVLVQPSSDLGGKLSFGGGGARRSEIDALMEDEEAWEQLLEEKGSDRLHVLKRTITIPSSGRLSQEMMISLFMRGGPPAEVLLLDEKLASTNKLSYEELLPKASDVISLQGLSKDDIKDLLTTLLP